MCAVCSRLQSLFSKYGIVISLPRTSLCQDRRTWVPPRIARPAPADTRHPAHAALLVTETRRRRVLHCSFTSPVPSIHGRSPLLSEASTHSSRPMLLGLESASHSCMPRLTFSQNAARRSCRFTIAFICGASETKKLHARVWLLCIYFVCTAFVPRLGLVKKKLPKNQHRHVFWLPALHWWPF
jgi:hypothetical protein